MAHWGKGYNLDSEGFVSDPEVMPKDFDMVELRADSGRRYNGWWTGQRWEALRRRDGEIITGWRKRDEYLIN